METLKNKLKSIIGDRRTWLVVASIAIMAALALVYFYPDDVQGNVLQQHDTRQGLANGHEAQLFNATADEPTRWTNALFGGMPTFQISPYYPSNSLFNWIEGVLTLGLPFPAGLLFLMMLGFFILLMTMRMKWYVSLLGSIAYGFSSYFIILIGAGHLWKFITLAYVPPTIAGIMLCYRGRYLAGAALTGLFGMMQIAANHVQMTYYFLFVVAGLMIAFLVKAVREKMVRQWAIGSVVALGAGLLAVAANLPSLYNTYEYSKETIRGGHSELTKATGSNESTGGLDRDYITAYSYGASETFTLLIPNVKGGASILPQKGQNTPLLLSRLDKAQEMLKSGEMSPETYQMLQQYEMYTGPSQYFGEPEMTNGPVYVGALICVFFLLGCLIVRGPLKWALVVLTVISILLALGRNCMWLTDFMIDYFPLYNKFRTPESILVIAEFTMPLLAAMALQKVLSGNPREVWQRHSAAIAGSFGVVVVICLLGVVVPGIFGDVITPMNKETGLNQYPALYSAIETLRLDMVKADSMRSLLFVLGGGAFLLLYLKKLLSMGVAFGGLALLVAGDLFFVNKRYLNHESFSPNRPTEETFPLSRADRAILADTSMNYRVLDLQRFMTADPSYHHKAIGGYHAAKLTRYQDVLDYYFMSGNRNYYPVLDMLNTRYVVQHGDSLPMFNPKAAGNAWLVDNVRYVDTPDEEIAALENLDVASEAVADRRFAAVVGESVAKMPGDTIFETSYAPNRLTYHASTSRGGVAVFSEVFFPWGWHATVDGKPAEIGRVNYILRAIRIPAGSHTVEMWFRPQSLQTTGTVATVAIIMIYMLLAGALVGALTGPRRKGGEKTPEKTE